MVKASTKFSFWQVLRRNTDARLYQALVIKIKKIISTFGRARGTEAGIKKGFPFIIIFLADATDDLFLTYAQKL
jgi:hypothetical protein